MVKNMIRAISFILFLFLNISLTHSQTASILPMGVTQFFDSNGNPLSGGKVYTYIVGTTTNKTTWQDSTELVVNTNPVILDAGGKAIIYGQGTYRQVVRDRNGNLIWDAVTSSTGSGGTSSTGDGDLVGTVKPWAGISAPSQYAFAYGQEISRTTYSVLLTAVTQTQTVICTSTSNTLTGLADTTQIKIGAAVETICVAPATTVVSKTASTITLSNPSSISITTTVTIFPFGNGNGTTTFNLPDLRGQVVAGRTNMGGTASSNLTSTYFGTGPDAQGASGGTQSQTLVTTNLAAHAHTSPAVTDPGHKHTFDKSSAGGTSFSAGGNANNFGFTTTDTSTTTTGITLATNTGSAGSGTAFSLIQPTMTLNYIIKITPDTNSAVASGVTSLGGMTGDITCGTLILCTGNTISVNTSTFFAAPSASVGLTIVTGSASTAMRSDAAPPLSQAIVPTWTGLHTFTATAGGIAMSGNPNISQSFAGQTDNFGFYSSLTAASATTAEVAAHFGIVSATGSANAVTAYKMGIAVTATCNSGSAYCWGINPVVNLGVGGSQRGGVGVEININNAQGNFTGSPGSPYGAGILITGSPGFYSSCAVCIEYGAASPLMWQAGLHGGPAGFQQFNTSFIWDESNSPIILKATGSHIDGINLSSASFSGNPFSSPGFIVDSSGDILAAKISLANTTNQLVFQSSGVTGTISWTPATTNKTLTLPNGTTDFTATGGTSQVVKQTSSGGAFTVARLACADLSDAAATCSSATGEALVVGTTTITSGATTRILYDNAGILGEYTISGSGTVVAMATGATLTTAVASGIWTASGTWTVPAYTLGGTISGGGNNINNVIIGAVTPLAGSFTTITASTSLTITSASATALTVGLTGATNPAFIVDASTASSATGLKIKSAAAAAGLALSVITSGTNENLTINAAGSGTITFGSVSTGAIIHTPATTLSAALTYGGVTLSNAVTGTGNMVLSASPTFTGTLTAATITPTTINAFTLGGTISGGGNQLNNIIIGTSTPLAGSFTTLNASGAITGSDKVIASATSGKGFWLGSNLFVDVNTYVDIRDASGSGTALQIGSTGIGDSSTYYGMGSHVFRNAAQSVTYVTINSTQLALSQTTDATSTSTGAITNPGGMSVNKRVFFNGLTASAGLQTAVICQSSAGEMIADSVACLASSERFKENINLISNVNTLASRFIVKSWRYKHEPDSIFPERYYRERIGLTAEDVAAIDPRLVEYDATGAVRTIDYNGVISVVAGAYAKLKADNDNLRQELNKIKRQIGAR